jgi:hypothetical protein
LSIFLQFRVGISFLFHVLLFIQSLFDDCFHFEHLLGRKMAQENKTDHQHETAPKLIEKPAKKQSG